MSDSLANLDLSGLEIDLATLKAIEQLLNQIELLINQKPETAIAFLYQIKNEIVQQKGQKSKPDTNMIVGSSELRQSFHAHVRVVLALSNKSASSHLLMFYAAECGLKSIWLKRNKLTGTDRIQDQTLLTRDGHNFAIWIKELRIPPTIGDKIPYFHLARGGSSWDIGKASYWLREVYDPRFQVDSEDNIKGFIILESLPELEQILPVILEETEEYPPVPRLVPSLARPEYLSHIINMLNFHLALPECSTEKIAEIELENTALKDIFTRLRGLGEEEQKIPFTREQLQLSVEEMKILEDNGVVIREKDDYYMPEIFRLGLGFSLTATGRPAVMSLARRAAKQGT